MCTVVKKCIATNKIIIIKTKEQKKVLHDACIMYLLHNECNYRLYNDENAYIGEPT